MIKQIQSTGLNSDTLYLAGLASIVGSIAVWFLKRQDGDDRASAERLGIFVGLWAPTFWAMGNAIKDQEMTEELKN